MSTEYSDGKSAHVVGSTRPLSEVLFTTSAEQSRIISEIDASKAIATQVWVLAAKIPLPNMPLFPVAFIPNKGRMTGQDYADLHLKLRQLCADTGLKLLSSAADAAKSEVNAQNIMMNVKTKTRLTYDNEFYGVHTSCPVYEDTGPHIAFTDVEHGRKSVRNNFLYGTHLLIIGFLYLCHAVLMKLLKIAHVPLYIRDIFNPEKQDDGAARRLFVDDLFSFLVDSEGNTIDPTFDGLFILTFIFGELFDAYMKRSMPHIERMVCIFRARHFLTIWRANFLADATFQTLIRMCDQFILLSLAHLEYYPTVPFMPWQYGSHFLEHFYGITRSFITEFTFGQLIQMNKHMTFRQRILSTGKFSPKKEKDSNNGYYFEFHDAGLTAEEIAALKAVPSRADLKPCFCGMGIPSLPLNSDDIHPRFRRTTAEASNDSDFDPGSDADDSDLDYPVTANDVDFEQEDTTIRVPLHPTKDKPVEDEQTLLGKNLTVSQALAHAAHHIVTERYLQDQVALDEAELEAIDRELDAEPETPIQGRLAIANLLNPAPPKSSSPPAIPTFLNSDGTPILREVLVEQRRRHCATTRVHSEKTRKPELKEALQQSEGLRKDTAHQKARYHRWIAAGPPAQWAVGCRLDVACVQVPNIKCRGVTSLTPLRLGSFVVMRSAIRLYLGEVLGIYRYGSVSGRHESFTDAETVDGLSYVSLRVAPERNINIFQHIAPPNRTSARSLALFTHAPMSEFVYLLTGVGVRALGNETYSLTGGDFGWERWQALTSRAVYRILDLPGFDEDSDDEDEEEEEYEEPEGTNGKKRKPKPPRGTVKKKKTDESKSGATQAPAKRQKGATGLPKPRKKACAPS
ncbi:hypothetical protein B0H14DRAFT_3573004 [Mycena olivaceomarginata]|nr:hypothetical protein B0H14DRAFT_3573004 [Mycena olivaceomarginata]